MSDIELSAAASAAASAAPSGAGAPLEKKDSAVKGFFKRLVKEKKLGTVGAIITLLLLLTGIFADVIAPYGMNETYVGDQLTEPSRQFIFGTDDIGRDVFSRVIHGARVSVIVGLSAAIISTTLSLLIGVTSGYIGGKLDLFVQRGVDIWISLPGLVILMIIISIVGTGLVPMIIILSLFYGVPGSRIIRGAVIGVKENAYISASRVVGCSTLRILLRHILPNILPTALVLFTIRVPAIILAEAGLSFLGFGLPPPTPSWGGMISGAGRMYMFQAPWMVLWPGVALALVVYGINMFGDALRDLVDPRLRGGLGRFGVAVKKAVEAELEPEKPQKTPAGAGPEA
jgi:peptide/nickel transport system permease protein